MKRIYFLFQIIIMPVIATAQSQITNFGNMKLHPGTTMTVYGDFKNNGTINDTGQTVTFKGGAIQFISGSSVTSFRNCVVNNSSGVKLQQSVNITNTLSLTTGGLFLQTNTLTVLNGIPAAISRTNGYIVSEQTNNSGKIAWIINSSAGSYIFPFGTTGGNYIPFTFQLTTGNIGTVTLATYPTNVANLPYPTNPDLVTHVNGTSGVDNSINTVDRFWQIVKTGPSGTADITFTATAAEVGTINHLKAYRWNSGTQGWETPPGTQTATALSVTVQGVSTFSPWTLAGNDSPLPVELLSFNATLNNSKQVDLNWETATEINSDHFIVERSMDAVHFEEVVTQPAAGNSNVTLNYVDLDPRPYSGTSYYRLKEVDLNGDYYYSQLASIYLDGAIGINMMVYPNPGNHDNVFMNISGANNAEFLLSITDMSGKMICSKNMYVEGDAYLFPLSDVVTLSPGIYTLRLIRDKEQFVQKLIIQ